MGSFNLLITASSILTLSIVVLNETNSISVAQNIPELNQLNVPMNVQNPESKQDFIQQCSQNLQAQGKSLSQANSYCNCSADAIYQYLDQTNSEIASDGAILETILQCRIQHIPTDN